MACGSFPTARATAGFFGKFLAYFGTNLSPALLGVGYIVGLNIGIVVLAGSVISWNIAIPIFQATHLDAQSRACRRHCRRPARDSPARMRRGNRGHAVRARRSVISASGAMLVGGLWALVSLRKSIVSGVKSGLAATRAGAEAIVAHTERDLPMKWVLIGIVLFTLPLAILYYSIVDNVGVGLAMSVIMVMAGFLFCSVSAYMAGLVGSSNNPVSGITIATILFAATVLLLHAGQGSRPSGRSPRS